MIIGAIAINVKVIKMRNVPFTSPFPSFKEIVTVFAVFNLFNSSGVAAVPGGSI